MTATTPYVLTDDIPMGRKRSPPYSLGGTSIKEN